MGNKSGKPIDRTAEYYQLLTDSTISGTTWKELSDNWKKHYSDQKIVETEWEKLADKDTEKNVASDLFGAATLSVNREKNRYVNILPFDSTRVKLAPQEGVEGSDYINANHISTEKRKYICGQAPLDHTIEDFHKMLWENNVSIVVMLTKLIEDGKIKASEYLASMDEDPRKYGQFHVEVLSEESVNKGTFIMRKFVLKRDSERRTLSQFHFMGWPDHEVPAEQELLDLILQVNQLEDESASKGPTVVHCSAGIGRTGTYIIVNSVLELITEAMKNDKTKPPSLNLMKNVHALRGMGSGMVNSIDQYVYCYQTIGAHIDRLIAEHKV